MQANPWHMLCAAALIAAVSGNAHAQSSSVTFEPTATAGTPAAPATRPVEIADTDYPLESLLANEEGKLTLNLSLDGSGRITEAQIAVSSGVPRLDAQTVQIAKARWQFRPPLSNGPVTAKVTWILPLQPVEKLHVEVPAAAVGTLPAKIISSQAVTMSDYPNLSIRAGEHGSVIVRYSVDETGSVGETQIASSSSFQRLDEAVINKVKAWKFQAATLEGKPVLFWTSVSVIFGITPIFPPGVKPVFHCFARPETGDDAADQIQIKASMIGGPAASSLIDRWAFVAQDGNIGDVLIGTRKGLMKVSRSLTTGMAQSAQYPKPDSASGCWYHDQVQVRR